MCVGDRPDEMTDRESAVFHVIRLSVTTRKNRDKIAIVTALRQSWEQTNLKFEVRSSGEQAIQVRDDPIPRDRKEKKKRVTLGEKPGILSLTLNRDARAW